MNILLLILITILIIGIIILIIHFLAKNALNSALGSLLAILSSLVAAMVAPEIEGRGDFNFHFGGWGDVTAQWARINTSRPLNVWYVCFVTVGVLIITTLYMVYKNSTPGNRRGY